MKNKYKFKAWYKTTSIMEHDHSPWYGMMDDNMIYLQCSNIPDIEGNLIYGDDLLVDSDGILFRIYHVDGGFAMKAHYWKSDTKDLTPADEFIYEFIGEAQTKSWIAAHCKIVGNYHESLIKKEYAKGN